MKYTTYGTREYYAEEVKKATTQQSLITEAVKARLASNAIPADAEEFAIYAEIMGDADKKIADANKALAEFLDKQRAEQAANDSKTEDKE